MAVFKVFEKPPKSSDDCENLGDAEVVVTRYSGKLGLISTATMYLCAKRSKRKMVGCSFAFLQPRAIKMHCHLNALSIRKKSLNDSFDSATTIARVGNK
jgi:hypothetical protein